MRASGKPKKRRGAPRITPTREIIDKICTLVAIERSNLTKIGKDNTNGLPGETVLYKWLAEADLLQAGAIPPVTDNTPSAEDERQYRAGVIEFQKCYARAREQKADSRADRIDEIAALVESGKLEPHQGRVLIDVEKWQAGKEKPSVYSDKHQIEHTGKDGGPIETSNKTLAMAIVGVLQDGGGDIATLLGQSTDKPLEGPVGASQALLVHDTGTGQ